MNRIMKLAGILLMGFILAYMGGCASAGGEERRLKKAGAEQATSPKGRPTFLLPIFPRREIRGPWPKLRPNGPAAPLRNYAGNSLQQR